MKVVIQPSVTRAWSQHARAAKVFDLFVDGQVYTCRENQIDAVLRELLHYG